MPIIPVFKRGLPLSSGSNHAQRHTGVKRNLCALMSRKWYEIAVWFGLWFQKACSKGVTRYETWGTGSGVSGENVEKIMLFWMHKLRWCAMCSYPKNVPRARDAESGSFKNSTMASSAKSSLEPAIRLPHIIFLLRYHFW
ncbi:hypothetical protein [Gimesia aquarii]|uniref:Uncharacterized protein n=1 Tax=Gimesia aquarii TaxID=2527964 RepID=A0A517WNY2_9PLAN|nr:hypothetical protein [Gimesia aquarii]QDU06972.1 hypothetical protein V202x_03170 [Gimesia aquarii]